MGGMTSGVDVSDSAMIAGFEAVLRHQGLIALLVFGVLATAWASLRALLPAAARHGARAQSSAMAVPGSAEPAWRRLLRIGFGLLWVFDGISQAQPKMAAGLPSQVIEPVAASSPRWIQDLVNWAGSAWSSHPLQEGASAVWIQVGIGLWMLAAARGAGSRLAGLASVAWGLAVWVFGEAFGGVLAPGLTWLSGAPGAAGLYVVAGALIALPERAWHSPRPGRLTLGGLGLFLAGMAVLQAWPGRGFWQGSVHGQPGTLAEMTQAMSGTPQPRLLSAWVIAFTEFDEAHGFAVNLFVVAVLAVTGAVFMTGRPWLVRPALAGFTIVCLADWALIEDFGFFGGLGTDPNSMIPFVLLAVAGYLALATDTARLAATCRATRPRWRDRVRLAPLCRSAAAAGFRSVVAASAVGVIILGAVPLAAAQASLVADTIPSQAHRHVQRPVHDPGAVGQTRQSAWPACHARGTARQKGARDVSALPPASVAARRAGPPPPRSPAAAAPGRTAHRCSHRYGR
jgi:hypothetical protein